jgi:hypothetical protein
MRFGNTKADNDYFLKRPDVEPVALFWRRIRRLCGLRRADEPQKSGWEFNQAAGRAAAGKTWKIGSKAGPA